MVVYVAALFASISIGCLSWMVSTRYRSYGAIAERLSEIFSHKSQENLEEQVESKRQLEEMVSLDESYQDPIARKLFLGGRRSKKDLQVFRATRIITFAIPVIYVLFQLATLSITSQSLLQILIIGCTLYCGNYFILNRIKKQRQERIMRSMPQFFDLLVISLEAGINFTAAFPRVIQEMDADDPLAQEFDQMHHEFLAGLSFGETCDRLAKRCEVEDLSVIMNALIESDKFGSSVASVLRVQAAELRDKVKQRVRETANRLPIKLLFPTLLIFTTIFVITLGPVSYKLELSMSRAMATNDATLDKSAEEKTTLGGPLDKTMKIENPVS